MLAPKRVSDHVSIVKHLAIRDWRGDPSTFLIDASGSSRMIDFLWLGYDGLSVHYAEVSAVLFYHPALDGRIVHGYGRVPGNIRAVVVTSAGAFLPSSRGADDLRQRLARWRTDRLS